MNKLEETLNKWCSTSGIVFTDAEAEENYRARTSRLSDVIQLKMPDRVPINLSWGIFPAIYSGYTITELSQDINKAKSSCMRILNDFQPDVGISFVGIQSYLHSLGYKPLRLPGFDLPSNTNFQFVEAEYVTADEFYDHFLDDPTDFMLRTYLPKVCTVLEPLKNLRPIRDNISYSMGMPQGILQFSSPDIRKALQDLLNVSQEAAESSKHFAQFSKEVMASGFPFMHGSFPQAPFDVIGDFFRGTKGVMLDIYRRPEKLIAAMKKLVPYIISSGLEAKKTGRPGVGIPLHKHADNFMSKEQFKTFFWPTLRKIMMGYIEEGLVPMPFFEGLNTSRLDIINDIPKGKAIYAFQDVDIHQFRDICGDTVCFWGNVPISLLCTGSIEQIKAYVKELIDVVGNKGGLILNTSANVENAKFENVKAMIDFTWAYGVYT